MATKRFKDALAQFSTTTKPFFAKGVPATYRSNVTAIQTELDKLSNKPQLLEDWILPQIKKNSASSVYDLLKNVTDEFDRVFTSKGIKKIGSYKTSNCRHGLIAFTKFILGQYKANLYLALKRQTDEESCRQVARNALFCTVEIAEKVRDGDAGSGLNKKHIGGKKGKGNMYYSWFCYIYQRKAAGQTRGTHFKFTSGQPNPEGMIEYILDDNQQAGLAIKGAVKLGIPACLKAAGSKFEDYMACHIWDKSCYDYRYHTSVFNLVLLPASIGGLSDYCDAVKEMLQYEAAMRFGVYPDGYSYAMSPATQKIYAKLDKEWRQPEQHQIVLANIKAGMIPKVLK